MRKRKQKFSLCFLIPSLALLGIFVIFPLFWAIIVGFTNQTLWGETAKNFKFVGFRNYVRLINDPDFYNSLRVTLIFIFCAVGGHLLLGLLFANLLRIKKILGKKVIFASILIPWVTPPLVAAYMWRSVLNLEYGWLNSILVSIGLNRIDWFGSYPILSILLPNWSRGMALAFLILFAALEGIPVYIYDAAKIDGSSSWQTFIYITLPLIKYSILVTLLISTFLTLSAFDMIYALTGGGPASQTEVFSIFIYTKAFKDMFLGYAGALSSILLGVSLILGIFYIKSIRVEV